MTNLCPICHKNLSLVGRSHNCVPVVVEEPKPTTARRRGRYRDAEKRKAYLRAYMREYMRKRRADA